MTGAYDGRQVVGMDLHRRRSVLVRMTEDGRKLDCPDRQQPGCAGAEIARRGRTRWWSWRPRTGGTGRRTCSRRRGPRCTWRIRRGSKAFTYRRVKNDLLTELPDVAAAQEA